MNEQENAVERPPVPTEPVGILPDERIKSKRVVLNTSKGQIVFDLFADEAPKTVSNFVALAESGYFDGLTFHRVVPGFVIQGGDPSGNGTGGPGYRFEDEPVTRDYLAGTVAMANAGPDTNGSQFFICLEDQPGLPKDYTIFGQVTVGLEAVRSIAVGDTMDEVLIESIQ
jgi:cyclophilin family peptidyl-prolyl cis-trans isomerase